MRARGDYSHIISTRNHDPARLPLARVFQVYGSKRLLPIDLSSTFSKSRWAVIKNTGRQLAQLFVYLAHSTFRSHLHRYHFNTHHLRFINLPRFAHVTTLLHTTHPHNQLERSQKSDHRCRPRCLLFEALWPDSTWMGMRCSSRDRSGLISSRSLPLSFSL